MTSHALVGLVRVWVLDQADDTFAYEGTRARVLPSGGVLLLAGLESPLRTVYLPPHQVRVVEVYDPPKETVT